MTYPCPTCRGVGGWWTDGQGRRLPFGEVKIYLGNPPLRWRECHDCIAGISSCCDNAGSAQPEPEGDHD
jgi:hypothetical protein